MNRTGISHLFLKCKVISEKGVLKTHGEIMKLVNRYQDGWFSSNKVHISKGEINQHKNEKIIKCFQLLKHLPSIIALLRVGALPWEKVTFSRIYWTAECQFRRRKEVSISVKVQSWYAAFTKEAACTNLSWKRPFIMF